ncbi:hypothetical protein DSCA_47490 [Desulfosarcina alkanivorans]|uniref:Uncharacterized protein n=1 Tax=Desulfosarcina alkanivorans TaxID=571177 RepID=A0A5K7YS96_9BACT|nr:hypothetical protein DSCA_47490 [Desulfosarcina alkanivorans]
MAMPPPVIVVQPVDMQVRRCRGGQQPAQQKRPGNDWTVPDAQEMVHEQDVQGRQENIKK